MPGINPIKVFETDLNQVASGSKRGGWVSGSPASLGFGQGVNVIFDLGDDWDQYPLLNVMVSNSGPGTPMTVLLRSNDIPSPPAGASRALRDISVSTLRPIADPVSAANVVGAYLVYNAGRYLIVQINNGDAANPLSAISKAVVVALPIGG